MSRQAPSRLAVSSQLATLAYPDEDMDDRVFAMIWGWSLPLHGAALSEQARLQRNGLASFTGNTEAALHALSRLIPGAIWKMGNDGGPNAEVFDPVSGRSYTSVGGNPAIALLSAAFHVAAPEQDLAMAEDRASPQL